MLCAAQWLSGTSEKPAVPAAPTLSVSSSAVAQCGDAEYNVSRAGAWSADLAETEEIIRSARLALEDASERLAKSEAKRS